MKQILPRCSLENPDRGLHLLDVPQSWQTMSFLKERERKEKKEVEVPGGLHQSKHTFIFIAITMLNELMCKVSFAVGVGPASLMKVAERRLLSELQIVLQDGSETCFDV